MRRSMLLLLFLLPACGTTSSVLAPMALNPIAAPSRGVVRVQGRATLNTGASAAEEGSNGVALYLPRAQFDLGAGIRIHRYFTLRVGGGVFVPQDAQRVGSSRQSAPAISGYLLGVSPTVTVPLDHGRTLLAFGPDFTWAVMPMRVWYEPLFDDGTSESSGYSQNELGMGMIFGGTVSASRWLGDYVRVTGTLGIRGQPGHDRAFAQDMPTDFGHVATVLGGDVSFLLGDAMVLAVESQWIGVAAGYTNYPTVGITLAGTIGSRDRDEDPTDSTTWDLTR